MRLKQQRHIRSCGLACVAMIADQPYKTVVDDFEDLADKVGNPIEWNWKSDNKRWYIGYGTTTKDLHVLLDYYGVKSNQRCVTYKGKLPDVSILNIDSRHERLGGKMVHCWHWVVCLREDEAFRILDPWKGKRKTLEDVGAIDSYMRIHV